MWREGCGSCAAPLPQQLSGNTARRAPPSGGFDPSGRTGAAVETVPREVRTELSSGGAPGATARLRFSPAYAPVELGPLTDIDAPATIRLGLQRRAAANLRSHVLRAMRRVTLLLVAGPAPFYLMPG